MEALDGRTVVFLGRLAAMPQRLARRLLAAQGARSVRSLSRRADLAVVGRLGHRALDRGRLRWLVARARALGVPCISEGEFLVRLGQRPASAEGPGTIAIAAAARQVGLGTDEIELLALFDIVAPCDGALRFRDLVLLKEVARLRGQGVPLGEIIAGTLALARGRGDAAEVALPRGAIVCTPEDGLLMRVGERLAELDGQLRLGLDETDGSTLDDLYDAAAAAEDAGDWAVAERLYRRCLARAPRDATAAFNLANVLRERGAGGEARLYLERAVALDALDAEAWYNLADLLEAGDPARARACLERALACDPEFADALFNLGRLLYRAELHDRAIETFERYLGLDPASDWARLARDHVAVCRQARLAARGSSAETLRG